MWGRTGARLDAIERSLAGQEDYLSDLLDVLRDVRDQLADINANTTPEAAVR